jgi:hypothetical protein
MDVPIITLTYHVYNIICSLSFSRMLFVACKKMDSNIDPLCLVANNAIKCHCLCSLIWQSSTMMHSTLNAQCSTLINVIVQLKKRLALESWSSQVFLVSHPQTQILNPKPCPLWGWSEQEEAELHLIRLLLGCVQMQISEETALFCWVSLLFSVCDVMILGFHCTKSFFSSTQHFDSVLLLKNLQGLIVAFGVRP